MDYIENLSLDTISSGVANEFFNRELEKVLENINDVNTESEFARKITIEISIKPNRDRISGEVAIKATSKLAHAVEHRDPIYFNKQGSKLVAVQAQKPIQDSIFDTANVTPLKGVK